MATQDFTTVFIVDKTPQQVFDAIKNVRAWWTGEIEGSSEHAGDEFTYRYKEYHYTRHRITEMIPGKKIVWQTTESSINFVQDKNEWTGTTVIFEIAEKDGQTELRFTHHGLTPEVECFDSCSGGWRYFIDESLYNFIGTSAAQPKTAVPF